MFNHFPAKCFDQTWSWFAFWIYTVLFRVLSLYLFHIAEDAGPNVLTSVDVQDLC